MQRSTMWIGLLVVLALIFGGIALFSGNDDEDAEDTTSTSETSDSEETAAQEQLNIVELAQATPSLSTLVAAVVEADLVETLSGPGPFTVFAPTNQAFANLLDELGITAEELLARDDLGAILTYHVVAGEAFAADLSDGQELTTVQGETLTVNIGDAGVTITDVNGNVSTVTIADVDASNGVVHVVDTVVLPTL